MTDSVAKINLATPPERVFQNHEYSSGGLVTLQAYQAMIESPTRIWTATDLKALLAIDIGLARRIINTMIIARLIDAVEGVQGGYQLSDATRQAHRRAILELEQHALTATRKANSMRTRDL